MRSAARLIGSPAVDNAVRLGGSFATDAAARAPLVALVAAAWALTGCTETTLTQSRPSLNRSGAVAMVCLNPADEDHPGRSIDECPDLDVLDEPRDLYALVTQTLRGEVAVINLDTASILDADPLVPGYGFLPVGENPVDIVATPGGTASFVAVAGEPGYRGIFALPSSCIFAPQEGELPRDIVTWPSCSLPSAPGRLSILVDPPNDDGELRAACDLDYGLEGSGAADFGCEADLSLETSPPGRRKLVVTMPDLGEVWVLDAQEVLNQTPGEWAPCPVDLKFALSVEARPDGLQQVEPEDLEAEPGCLPELNYGPAEEFTFARPSDVEVDDEVMYVGDVAAPVIHRLDVSDPCAIVEQPPLFPLSYEEPGRAVFTTALAVSPVTHESEKFVYAVDEQGGGVMVFDVGANSSDRTPILRTGSALLPYESPDRLRFAAPARDVAFVYRDVTEADPETGVAEKGVLCDPDPALDESAPDSPAVEYRTSQNYGSGARPSKLRGIFGFIALTDGSVIVTDVEDFDAPCRRPVETNTSSTEDFRGCANDPDVPGGLYTVDGTSEGDRTASDDQSCRIVDQHRTRSADFFLSSDRTGVGGPSLRTFPQLRDGEGRSLPTNQTDEGLEHPKLLAVDFSDERPAEVRIGTSLYRSDFEENRLETDPTQAERNGLSFILRQPRTFTSSDAVAAFYEGAIMAEREVAFLTVEGDTARLTDHDGVFCDRGVEDLDLALDEGEELGVPERDLGEFAQWHMDYVQITADLPDEDDRYWDVQTCGSRDLYFTCEDLFGTSEEPQPSRDLAVLRAYQDHLIVAPRDSGSSEDHAELLEQMDCCFGGEALSYVVRGGTQWIVTSVGTAFQHNVAADPSDEYRCIRGCNPRRSLLDNRVLEIAHQGQVDPASNSGIEACGPGECLACVSDEPGPIEPDSPCVHQSVTTRFAIYRGRSRSQRDMAFSWEYSGGFEPLGVSIAATTTSVSPQRMQWFPQTQDLIITDGASQGLVFVELDSIGIRRYFY